MTKIVIRDAVAADFSSILKLNEVEVHQTSPLNVDKLCLLDRLSCYHKVAAVNDRVAAFLLAMRENAPYLNENYSWFASRFPTFLYIDRIVVGTNFSGLKIGSLLYQDIFQYAYSHGIKIVTCEYNIEPPNLVSQAFHKNFGFKELDTQWVDNGKKRVSLQAVVRGSA